MSIESEMPSNHLSSPSRRPTICHPLLLPPSIFLSIRVFSSESGGQSIGSFSFSISPSHEYSGLISFRMDWFDLLAVQQTLKSLLQHYSSKASILQCSALSSNSNIHTWLLKKLQLWLDGSLLAKWCLYFLICIYILDFPGGSDGKASVYNAGDLGSIPGSGRSPGEGNGNLL